MSFFFSRPFHENFEFLKNCLYDFHKILHSHSAPKGASAFSKALKSYDWNARNIAKKWPKSSHFSTFFPIFSKTVHTIRTKFSRVILHHVRVLCATASISYDWNARNIVKISPKMAKNSPLSTFYDFLKNCPYDSNKIFYSHSTPCHGPLCAISLNSYGWDVRNSQN